MTENLLLLQPNSKVERQCHFGETIDITGVSQVYTICWNSSSRYVICLPIQALPDELLIATTTTRHTDNTQYTLHTLVTEQTKLLPLSVSISTTPPASVKEHKHIQSAAKKDPSTKTSTSSKWRNIFVQNFK